MVISDHPARQIRFACGAVLTHAIAKPADPRPRLPGRRDGNGITSFAWSLAPPEVVPDMQRRIDEAAGEAGRHPAEIRRVYNLIGEIADAPAAELLHGPVNHWVETLAGFALELGFDTFVFWPGGDAPHQVERFAEEVIPGVREVVAHARRGRSGEAAAAGVGKGDR